MHHLHLVHWETTRRGVSPTWLWKSTNPTQLDIYFLGLVLNNASFFGITMWFINKCYVKFKYNKCKFCCSVPHTKFFFCFLACSQLVFGGLYFAAYKMPHHFFSLNLLGTVLLYIMMNSSFMSVHHLVCHPDLNEMETHKVATLSLRWLYQITLSASFEGRLKFWSNFPFVLPSVLKTLSEYSFFIHLI